MYENTGYIFGKLREGKGFNVQDESTTKEEVFTELDSYYSSELHGGTVQKVTSLSDYNRVCMVFDSI